MKRTKIRGLPDKKLAGILDNHAAMLRHLLKVMLTAEHRTFFALLWGATVTGALVYLGVTQ